MSSCPRDPLPRLYPGDVRAIWAALALAGLILAALLLSHLGVFLMKRRLIVGCALAAIALGLSGCAGMPGIGGGASTSGHTVTPAQAADRAMLAAETAFNVAATAELDAKAVGLLTGDNAVRADAIRRQSYATLKALRVVYAQGSTPNLTALLQLTNQLLMLAGRQPAAIVAVPIVPTLQP